MENRSHALMAGLFTLLLILAGVFTVYWLSRDGTNLVPYDLVTVDSVQGLTVQADVRYRGLPVGKVESISFDTEESGPMLVRIGVREGTPMTDTLKATVEMKGITGVAYVDLDDDGMPGKPIYSSPDNVARIVMQPGLTERLMNRAGELMDGIQRASAQVQALLGPANQRSLARSLENAAQITNRLDQMLAELQPALQRVGPMMAHLGTAADEASAAAREFSGLAHDFRGALKQLMSPGGIVEQATQSVADIRRATGALAGVVPQVSEAVGGVGQAAAAATRTLKSMERAPQSLIFGAPEARPGPGEPGFSGFTARGGSPGPGEPGFSGFQQRAGAGNEPGGSAASATGRSGAAPASVSRFQQRTAGGSGPVPSLQRRNP